MIVVPVDRAEYLQDALDLFAYCNGPPDSAWGKIRAQNGHPEPYRVKYWEIGNQVSTSPAPDCAAVLGQLVPVHEEDGPRRSACIEGLQPATQQARTCVDFLEVPHSEYTPQSKELQSFFVSDWTAQTGLDAAAHTQRDGTRCGRRDGRSGELAASCDVAFLRLPVDSFRPKLLVPIARIVVMKFFAITSRQT